MDLKCVDEAKGGTYYRDHLPLVGKNKNIFFSQKHF